MILVIDNYDSFTFNLVHLLAGMDEEIAVMRNDARSASEFLEMRPRAIILSPGPKTPDDAGVCLDLIRAAAGAGQPLFGVCLGMQAIAQCFGGLIRRADALMHGKTCPVVHRGGALFDGLPSPFTATRYHSLVADPGRLPGCLTVEATAGDTDTIMAVAHRDLPIAGVQFHPESVASDHGADIMRNFLKRAAA